MSFVKDMRELLKDMIVPEFESLGKEVQNNADGIKMIGGRADRLDGRMDEIHGKIDRILNGNSEIKERLGRVEENIRQTDIPPPANFYPPKGGSGSAPPSFNEESP